MPPRPKAQLKEGDKAPNFSAVTNEGQRISLIDLKGRFVVLYFYPRDNTPGCTKEACAFRDVHPRFQRKRAAVLGVSTDSMRSHERFAEKYRLPFPLLVDEDKKIVRAYGAWGEKSFMGRTFPGTRRMTFLIGPDGRIRKIWAKVKPVEHPQEVLQNI